MKKEFTFIKGMYTNKPLFDNGIIKDSLFILNKRCNKVDLESIDNAPTQKILLGASKNRVCKLYSITPDQIIMEGNLVQNESGNSYKFTTTVRDTCISDPTENIPTSVKDCAKTLIEDCLNVTYNLSTDNIGINEDKSPINVNFDYSGKRFVKSMRFKVTGKVNKLSFETLSDVLAADETIYSFSGNNYTVQNYLAGSYFLNGHKYTECSKHLYVTVLDELTIDIDILDIEEKTLIKTVAKIYNLPNGFYFKTTRGSSEKKYQVSQSNTIREYCVYDSRGNFMGEICLPVEETNHLRKDNVSDNMYIIQGDSPVALKQNYPTETANLVVYTIDEITEDITVKDGIAYKKDSDDSIYKRLSKTESVDVDSKLVQMQEPTILSPIYGDNYIIEIDPTKIEITATEA